MVKSKVRSVRLAKLDPLRGNFNVSEGLSRVLLTATQRPSRQLLRQYLRILAYTHLKRSFPREPRRILRKMAFRLATRDQFISEVANVKAVR